MNRKFLLSSDLPETLIDTIQELGGTIISPHEYVIHINPQ